MKKSINDRCPLQVECERKRCDFIHTELECPYYSANARKDYYIDDQEEIRNRRDRERMDEALLASLGDDDDDTADGGLVYIPIEQLYPHPDNPRKDLGDLTELADSIKANGVLQNLTVVPRTVTGEITGETWQKGYTVVIGHRRLAASKLAGLKELPCVITDMDLRSQVQTMLMENIQRADLTLYEQAQGFQMMLDLGDSIDEIARKSGFSQTTVRRRVKLLELDQEKFKASVSRGANLMDYMELDKIDDPELKNEVLEAIGTNNFRQKLASAIETEKSRKLIADRVQALSAFATQVEKVDHSTMRYVRNYGIWNKKDEVTRPDDADTVAYFFCVGMHQVDLYRQIVEEPEDTESAARAERIKAELERRHAELETISRAAYQRVLERVNFYKNLRSHLDEIVYIIQAEGVATGRAAAAFIGGYMRITVPVRIDGEVRPPHVPTTATTGAHATGSYMRVQTRVPVDGVGKPQADFPMHTGIKVSETYYKITTEVST